MSPQIANPFAGHLAQGDPRGPLSVAGGCDWPTVPAYRYWLISDDATGDLAFFNTDPVLVQFASTQPAHDAGLWSLFGTNPNIIFAFAAKGFVFGATTYTWFFNIQTVAIPEAPLTFQVVRNLETCNRDIPLPNVWAFDIDRGVTGDTFRMEQIEWDQEAPPPEP